MSKRAKEVKKEETLTEKTTKETKQPEEAVKDDTKLLLIKTLFIMAKINEINNKVTNI